MPMMKISASEISSIVVIEASMNMVLLVHQRNSSRPIVVKGEDGKGRENVGAMLEFHATAFSKLRALPFDTERLTLAEIEELRKCDPGKISTNPKPTKDQWLLKLGKLLYGKSDDRHGELDKGKHKAVVKLSYVEELADVKGLSKDLQKKQALVALLQSGSREAHDAVFALGQILAVDFFIGNHDRFRDETHGNVGKWTDDQQAFGYQGSIIGDQNVFFSFKNGRIVPTGLDTFDSGVSNPWSDMSKTIEELEQRERGRKWPGRILSHGAERVRDNAAAALVGSLIQLVGADVTASLRKKYVKSCHSGISDGKKILRSKYKLGDNLQALSAGIRSRWKIIRGS